jgi:fibronectin-binding autotransporter adhesin
MMSLDSVKSSPLFGSSSVPRSSGCPRLASLLAVVFVFAASIVLVPPRPAVAQLPVVTLTTGDSSGASSFNSAGHWSNGVAPSSGSAYSVSVNPLRTPATAGNFTFGGASLQINTGGDMGFKGSSAATITVNDLILSGGSVTNSTGQVFTLAGTANAIANSLISTLTNDPMVVAATLTGTANLTIGGNFATTLSATNSTFSGAFLVDTNNASLATSGANVFGMANGVGVTTVDFLISGTSLNMSAAGSSQAIAALNSNTGLVGAVNLGANTLTISGGSAGNAVSSFGGVIAGAGALAVTGGTTTLYGTSTFAGGTTVNSGAALLLDSAAAMGSSSGSLVVNGGVVDLKGVSPTTGTVSLASGSIIDSVGGGVMNASAYTLQSGTVSAALGGSGAGLTKTTSGLAMLTAANSYSGSTVIAAGTLQLGATGTLGSGNVTINSGGVLDVSAYGSGGYNFGAGVLTAGRTASFATDIKGSLNVTNAGLAQAGSNSTMTINGNLLLTSGTVNYFSGDTIALVNGGALSQGGGDFINLLTSVGTGTYTLFTGSSVPANPASYLTLVGDTSTRQNYAFNVSGNTAVTLTVSGAPANLQWTGGNNQTWDTGTSQSWHNLSTSAADYFYTGDNVTFNDAAGTANANVTINGGTLGYVQPGSVTVSNTAVNYTFSGDPIAGSTSLVKHGPGSLTLNSGNNYTGGTTVNGGVLNDGAFNSLGSGSLAVSGGTVNLNNQQSIASVAVSGGLLNLANGGATLGNGPLTLSGGSLDNTSGAAMSLSPNNPQNWNGSFAFLGSNPLGLGNGNVALGAAVTLTVGGTGTLEIDGKVSNDGNLLTVAGAGNSLFTGVISGSGGLTVSGGSVTLSNAGNSYSGPTVVSGGTLSFPFSPNGLLPPSAFSGTGVVQIANWGGASSGTFGSGFTGQIDASGICTFTGGVNPTAMLGSNLGSLNLAAATIMTINGGTIQVDALNGPTGSVLQNSAAATHAPAIISLGVNNGSGTYSGNFTDVNGTGNSNPNGAISVVKLGAGTQYLYGVQNSGSLTVSGGLLVLGGNNTYAGPTAINGGTLQLGDGLGNDGSINSTSGVADNAALVYNNLGSQSAAYVISGSGSLAMIGGGQLTLGGTNTYSDGTVVAAGVLQLGNSAALGSGALAANGGMLDLAGFSVTVPSFSGAAGVVTNSAGGLSTLTVTQTGTTLFGGTIVDGGGKLALKLLGNGRLTLGGANTYTGGTTIGAGTLALGAAGALGNGNVTINPGGVLDVSAYGNAGYTFGAGLLTAGRTASFATDINGTLNVNNAVLTQPAANSMMTISGGLALSNGTVAYNAGDQIAVGGALTLGSTDYISPLAPLGTGTFTLFTYNGNLSGGTADLAMGGAFLSGRQDYSFSASAGTVSLTVNGGPANLQWTGGNNQTWDTVTSQSWHNLSTSAADYFYAGDNVIFNDAAGTANANVTINGGTLGNVQPGSVTVGNTAVNYTFSGDPIAGSTSLVKHGPGSLTLNSGNNYTGGTTVNGGILNDGAFNSLGSGSLNVSGGTVNLNNQQSIASAAVSGGLLNLANGGATLGNGLLTLSGGSLNNTSGSPVTLNNNNALNLNGSFVFVGSNPLNTGAGPVTLGAAPTVTVSSGTLTIGGSIAGGFGLTTSGAGMLVLGASNSYTGNTTIAQGTLQLGAAGAIPSGANTGNIVFSNAAAAAVLDLGGNNATVNGLSQPSASTTNMVLNNLSGGTATLSVGGSNASSTFAGLLADNNNGGGGVLALTKFGSGVLTLNSANTYSGLTTINGGTLQLGNANAAQNSTVSVGIANSLAFSPGLGTVNIGGLSGGSNFALADTSGGSLTLSVGGNNQTTTYAGDISGPGALLKTGGGALWLSSSNSFTGGTTVSQGTLDMNYGNQGANIGTLGGTLTINPGATVVVSEAKGLGLAGFPSSLTAMHITNGLLNYTAIDTGTGLGGGQTVYMTGGTIQTNGGVSSNSGVDWYRFAAQAGYDDTIYTLASGTTAVMSGTIRLSTAGLFNTQRGSAPVDLLVSAGIYSDSAPPSGISKSGPGVMELTGINTYAGSTTINDGVLQLGDGLGNDGSISSTSGVADNAALVYDIVGSQSPTYVTSGSGALAMIGSGQLTLGGTNTYTGGTVVANGTVFATNNAAIEDGTNLYVGSGLLAFGTLIPAQSAAPGAAAAPAVAPVPEPGTLALLATLLGSAGLYVSTLRRSVLSERRLPAGRA